MFCVLVADKTSEVVPVTCAPVLADKHVSDDARSHSSPVMHEMQALHYDLDFLQHEMDLL